MTFSARLPSMRPVPLYELLSDAGPDPNEASLETLVMTELRAYVRLLQGHTPSDLYGLIMPQLERPLVQIAMEMAEGRQLHAAAMLGIHRNTLRVRLKALGLDERLGRESP